MKRRHSMPIIRMHPKHHMPIMPSLAEVGKLVKVALHDPDPVIRAVASARLTLVGLPASATAIVMVAERAAYLARPLDD